MNNIIVLFMAILAMVQGLYAQETGSIYRKDLPIILIGQDVSLHFISPEPIRYVDITTHAIVGDLPLKNVLRLKVVPDSSLKMKGRASIVTIIGESFIAQYALSYADGPLSMPFATQVNILPEQTHPLDAPDITLTSKQMENFSMRILDEPSRASLRKAKAFGLEARLNQVYTAGEHIFLDITYFNQTNLSYEVDEMRFKIEDKKISKSTNVQSLEIKPVWQLYPNTTFKKQYRNIYVLKKTTFPGRKVLNIELSEKQISGRVLTLQIKYGDILKADSL